MKIHSLPTPDVFKHLRVSEPGLTESEVAARCSEFGRNEIQAVKRRALGLRFVDQLTHWLAILLWIAAGLSFLSESLHPGEGMVTLGWAIVAVIMINAVFAFFQEYRAEKALAALKKLLPFYVKVRRDGQEKEVSASDLVPGDWIFLSEGDKVPADARLIEATGLMVDMAALTGESEPVPRMAGPFEGDLLESPNIVWAGTTAVRGSGRAVVFATGMQTEFGRIAHLTSAVESGLSPLQREILKATRIVSVIAAGVGLVFFVLGFTIGRSLWDNFIFAIGITVALVPEGMLPIMTLALAMGSQRMAKRNALIKTLPAVETLGSVTVICTDKTGTLTQNRMAVKKLWFNAQLVEIEEPAAHQATELIKIAYLCNNAPSVDGPFRGDPTEAALRQAAVALAGEIKAERLLEIPFDSERKRMTTVNHLEGQRVALTKGALEGLLPLCHRMLLEGKTVPIDHVLREKILLAYHALTGMGLRVLAFCSKALGPSPNPGLEPAEVEKDMTLVGLIGLEDPPRPEVPEALQKCRSAGIRVIMITGDSGRTAEAIAREIGLVKGKPAIVEGRDFVRMDDKKLRAVLKEKEVLFARMTPKHKLRIVSLLKAEGERVAVTGDGVNDAPALKKADIGIAMGRSGTDVAREASDMVLLDDNFASIVSAMEEGRAVYENIRKFLAYIFTSNIPEAVPYLAYVLLKVPLALTILQILTVDLGTNILPALALGAEKPAAGVMRQPPRDPKERLLSGALLARSYVFLGLIEAAAGLFGFFYVLRADGWHWGRMPAATDPLYMEATTACLSAIIVTQMANVFACRSMTESIFTLGFFSNPRIFLGLGAELTLQLFLVYHPWGHKLFSTAPMAWSVWLVLLPFAFILFLSEELRKSAVRTFHR